MRAAPAFNLDEELVRLSGGRFAEFVIRQAKPEDCPQICHMVAALSVHEGQPEPQVVAAALQRDAFGSSSVIDILVADLGRELAGYAITYPGYDVGSATRGLHLEDLWVEKAWRRRGLGKRMMAAVALRCRRTGGRWLQWGAYVGNEEAQSFYGALGANRPPGTMFDMGPAALDRLIKEVRG